MKKPKSRQLTEREGIRRGLIAAYMKGFRAGASNDNTEETKTALRRLPKSAFARGWAAGQDVLVIGNHQAERFAEETLEAVESVLEARDNGCDAERINGVCVVHPAGCPS